MNGADPIRLKQILLLAAILAGGVLLGAHAPLHDYELARAAHDDHGDHHAPLRHDHPVRTPVIVLFFAIFVVIALTASLTVDPAKIVVAPTGGTAGPVRCDDDVGLHDILSVYRI